MHYDYVLIMSWKNFWNNQVAGYTVTGKGYADLNCTKQFKYVVLTQAGAPPAWPASWRVERWLLQRGSTILPIAGAKLQVHHDPGIIIIGSILWFTQPIWKRSRDQGALCCLKCISACQVNCASTGPKTFLLLPRLLSRGVQCSCSSPDSPALYPLCPSLWILWEWLKLMLFFNHWSW